MNHSCTFNILRSFTLRSLETCSTMRTCMVSVQLRTLLTLGRHFGSVAERKTETTQVSRTYTPCELWSACYNTHNAPGLTLLHVIPISLCPLVSSWRLCHHLSNRGTKVETHSHLSFCLVWRHQELCGSKYYPEPAAQKPHHSFSTIVWCEYTFRMACQMI